MEAQVLPEDGDLGELFYVPALETAKRNDRLTGYFSAGALRLAAPGVVLAKKARTLPHGGPRRDIDCRRSSFDRFNESVISLVLRAHG